MSTKEQLNDNIDRPDRHNINPMNRPSRVQDPAYNEPSFEDKAFADLEATINRNKAAASNQEQHEFGKKVTDILDDIEKMLFQKNVKYGNSALEPKRIFSQADASEQIKVRIDDKLSRIANGTVDDEDTINDLIGYLVLLKISNENL